MLPVVTRSAEVVLDARAGLAARGGARARRPALAGRSSGSCCRPRCPGIVTGSLLAVARAAGETAPLLFTAAIVKGTSFDLSERMNSLPVQIFNDVGQPQDRLVERAWGAALTLVAMILVLTLVARLIQRRSRSRMTPTTHDAMPDDRSPIRPPSRAARADGGLAARARRAQRSGAAAERRAIAVTLASAPTTATTHAVKDVSLDYAANQVTAMIGPSGCGKSTLVRCINRMHEEIPGARAEGDGPARRRSTSTARASTSSPCGGRSAWCSRSPTRSRRCRSSTTSPRACG